jgi:hypothetical protein
MPREEIKMIRSTLTLSLLAAWSTACGTSVRTMDVSHAPTYTMASFNASPKESVQGLQNAIRTKEGAVLLLKKGDKVPVQLRAGFGPITLEPGENHIVFAQDTYLYFGPKGILLSPDGAQWAAVSDGAALSKVFGLHGQGTFQLGFGVAEGKPPSFTILLEKR